MKLGLRTRLIGTIVGAILVFFIVRALAARSTMSNDLSSLGRKNVQSGSLGFNGYWEQKRDQIRLLTQQVAIQEAIRKNVGLKATKALETALTGVARNAGLSFLTIVDRNGIVIARANGGGAGLALKSSYVKRALEGESVNTAARLSLEELTPEALAPQVSADIKDQRDAVVGKMTEGLALVSAAPIPSCQSAFWQLRSESCAPSDTVSPKAHEPQRVLETLAEPDSVLGCLYRMLLAKCDGFLSRRNQTAQALVSYGSPA